MPVNIKGKSYVLVNERVKEFHKQYPNGSIVTELIEFTDRFITKTIATPDVEKPERFFTGLAYEMVGSSQINKTSALENCETSSCGRSLSFLNIGIDGSIASADEVENAIHQQEAHTVTESQKGNYQSLLTHKCFDGKKKQTNEWWVKVYDEPNPKAAAHNALKTMEKAIKLYENPETIKQEEE